MSVSFCLPLFVSVSVLVCASIEPVVLTLERLFEPARSQVIQEELAAGTGDDVLTVRREEGSRRVPPGQGDRPDLLWQR